MVIKEEELKHIFLYCLKPYFEKYGFNYVESNLNINDKIYLCALLQHNNQNIKIEGSFLLDYKNNYILFKDIDAKVRYSFLELSFIQILKQFLKIPELIIKEDKCLYPINLPIETIIHNNHELIIKIRDF